MTTSGGAPKTTRVVLVYRHKLLRDLALTILARADVEVVGVIAADDPLLEVVEMLHPDVVIVDQAAEDLFDHLSRVTVVNRDPVGPSRLVTIGLAERTMVVSTKTLVADVDANGLIAVVLGQSPGARPVDVATGD